MAKIRITDFHEYLNDILKKKLDQGIKSITSKETKPDVIDYRTWKKIFKGNIDLPFLGNFHIFEEDDNIIAIFKD